MCRPAECQICSKKTWVGCGLHVPRAMDNVPKDQWCTCESASGIELNGYPPKFGDAK
ncbi:hypothetical protein CORT_0H02370 [Candida orthopsilosis Co 90-125]|uniref:Uncharacterized protein n=1 Tax=Candida orthopsilosis (strain 90-125) TaxID=1136231 RepID=H8XB98_CANO9|nr:hypothetical protein CORT_0H02370 [Candida orthopsilosis Co 90-125]CCG25347.1 hypothetical protein CORT_0H02370 [Candida orthopsilosis Co 90-125]